MMKFKLLFITLVILVAMLGTASADWIFGDFEANTNGWFKDAPQNATNNDPTQTSYGGVGCLRWVITYTGDTAWGSSDMTCAPAGNFGWDFTGETTGQARIAFTGSMATVNVAFLSKSGTSWSEAPAIWNAQATDGAFVTYDWPVDSTFVTNPTQVSFPVIVSVGYTGLGTVTCYMDYAKTFGSMLQAPADVYADFHYDREPSWIVNWDGTAVLNHSVGQNSTGLMIDKSGIGTLTWIDLDTTTVPGAPGAAVSTNWGGTNSWAAYSFIEYRIKVGYDSPIGSARALNADLFVQGPWQAQSVREQLPIDDQFHTYSISYDRATSGGSSYNRNYNQIGINVSAHADSRLAVTIDYIKFKQTGTPLMMTNATTFVKAYTDPANDLYILSGTTQDFTVFQGEAPFTWSLTSVSGNPGSLNTTSGETVTFNAVGGVSYLTVTDNQGRSFRTPNIIVTATSAPLATDWDLMDIR